MKTEMIPLNISVAHPSKAHLSLGANAALALVESFSVVDDATYEIGAEELADIKGRLSRLDTERKGITKPMDDAKAAVMALFRGPVEVLTRAEGILKGKLGTYAQEQARLAAEQRRVAEDLARAERARQAKEAADVEAAAAAERAKAQAAIAELAAAADDSDRFALEREVAERSAEADRLRLDAEARQLSAQMVVAAVPIIASAPKVAGLSSRTTLDFEVIDKLAFVRHVAANPDLLHLLVADQVRLRSYVRGLGLACNLPGVAISEVHSISSRKS